MRPASRLERKSFSAVGASAPSTRPLITQSGVIYGTAFLNNNQNGTTVFKLKGRHATTLDFFSEDGPMYGGQRAGLAQDAAGNLYGATCEAGANGMGNVFKITAHGKLSTLHDFAGPALNNSGGLSDGRCARGDLALDAKGNLIGTTQWGGKYGYGTVFSIAPDGNYRILHDFARDTDGGEPWSGVTFDEHGAMYGTTNLFGPGGEEGTLYKLSPNGAFQVLHSFDNATEGNMPFGTLARDAKGNLYGVTATGTMDRYGALFRMRANGKFEVLHTFQGNEQFPTCAPAVDPNGNVFFASQRGGKFYFDFGTIYELGE